MEQTTNYGLNKPGGSDYARVDALNANMDAVDAALKDLESKAEGRRQGGRDGHRRAHRAHRQPPWGLETHEADQVKHLTAAERTAWNAKADGTATSAHISNTNNPHGVTAAQVGALPLSGGTLTGNLDIAKTIASVVLRTGDSSNRLSGRLMKNANVEGTVDDGLYLTDYGADGSEATLKIQGGQQRLRIKLGGTDYAVYHEGSKPTPADIGAAVKYRYTATIPTGTWTEVSGGGYYKDITVSGITAAMTPCVGVVQTSDVVASELMVEEFANNIRRIETMAGKIRVYTRGDGAAPSVNIPIQLVGTV